MKVFSLNEKIDKVKGLLRNVLFQRGIQNNVVPDDSILDFDFSKQPRDPSGTVKFLFFGRIPWKGGRPDTNTYLRKNGQFSGQLIFDKKLFFRRKNVFIPINKNSVFLKKTCSFFFKISKTFPPTINLSKFFLNFFEKTFSKKNIFF